MKYSHAFFILFASLLSIPVFAADIDPGVSQLHGVLSKMTMGEDAPQIKPTPIKGLYEVILGNQVVYMNADASYYLNGDLVEMATRKNLTEASRSAVLFDSMQDIKNYPEEKMLVYTPKTKVEHTVTVVTDINCGFCRKLHSELDEYMANGIKLRYIFMPVRGPEDFATTVSVWCSADRNKAFNTAMSGGTVEAKTCDNPIEEQLKLTRGVVSGTPAIILEDSVVGGYRPVKDLVETLKARKNKS